MSNLWGKIDLENWKSTPCIIGKCADETDIEIGNAVFCIPSGSIPHKMPLPICAIYVDEVGQRTPVIIIQAEEHDETIIIGARPLDGGNMVCTFPELEIMRSPNDEFL